MGFRYVFGGIHFILQNVFAFQVYVFKVVNGLDATWDQFLDSKDVYFLLLQFFLEMSVHVCVQFGLQTHGDNGV